MRCCRAIIANREIGPKSVPAYQDSSDAIVILPPLRGRLRDVSLLRGLSRGLLEEVPAPAEPLAEVLRELGLEMPGEGLAALRMWGQTGDRPGAWVAAADPVYMEPRLDRLFLHVLGPDEISHRELRRLFDGLQDTLGKDGSMGFALLGNCGYIRSEHPMATAQTSTFCLDGQNPQGAMPRAESAAGTLNLVSEIEMTLHSQPVNAERLSRGHPPVNSLWIWGGGVVPEQGATNVPPLFGDELLMRGYWESVGGRNESWPGSADACLDATPGGFVAVVPGAGERAPELESDLLTLRDALRSGRLGRLVLISADGIRLTLSRLDRFRFWRRIARELEAPSA